MASRSPGGLVGEDLQDRCMDDLQITKGPSRYFHMEMTPRSPSELAAGPWLDWLTRLSGSAKEATNSIINHYRLVQRYQFFYYNFSTRKFHCHLDWVQTPRRPLPGVPLRLICRRKYLLGDDCYFTRKNISDTFAETTSRSLGGLVGEDLQVPL